MHITSNIAPHIWSQHRSPYGMQLRYTEWILIMHIWYSLQYLGEYDLLCSPYWTLYRPYTICDMCAHDAICQKWLTPSKSFFSPSPSQLWTPMNIILLNLVCSDFSVSIVGNPFTLSSAISHRWLFGRKLCVAYGFFMSLLGELKVLELFFCKTPHSASVPEFIFHRVIVSISKNISSRRGEVAVYLCCCDKQANNRQPQPIPRTVLFYFCRN